jgi:lipopolysaccharide export system permease protein
MKKILFRKLLLDYMSFFIIALLSSSIIIWVFQAVNFLDIMIEDGRDYLVYFSYSILNFPKIFSRLFPFVLFFSLFYITLRYEMNNELLIFWNFGINKIEIINLIIKTSIFLALIQVLLTSLIVPKSQELARFYLKNSTVNFFENFIKPQRFNDTIKGTTIYSEKKDIYGNLYNLYLKKEIDKNNFQITYAKKGQFKEINNIPILVLFEGETLTGKNNEITNLSFSKSDFPLNSIETNTTTYTKTQELSSLKLGKCIYYLFFLASDKKKIKADNIENCSIENSKNILKEFYKRIVIPLYIPILMLIPFLVITSSKESVAFSKLRFVTFLIGLFFIIFSETTTRLISEKLTNNISISFIPFVAFILLYLFFFNKFSYRKNFK